MLYDEGLNPVVLTHEITELVKLITESKVEYDYIAFRGYSGAILAGPLSIQLKKPLVNVRKPQEPSHQVFGYSGRAEGKYIVVDDFISTGSTVRAITEALGLSQCQAIFVTDHPLWKEPTCQSVKIYCAKERVNA